MMRTYLKLWNKTVTSDTFCIVFPQESHFKRIMLTYAPVTSIPLYKNSPNIFRNPQNLQILRKSSKTSKQKGVKESESDSNTSENPTDEVQEKAEKGTKIMNISVNSLRVDAILRSAIGLARNKIELAFYESKIRINGEKITKKSATVHEGDEVDLIKGPDLNNPNFIYVTRVEVLSVKPNQDSISVKVKRCKSLLIEAY